jgi:hypothetical protein
VWTLQQFQTKDWTVHKAGDVVCSIYINSVYILGLLNTNYGESVLLNPDPRTQHWRRGL